MNHCTSYMVTPSHHSGRVDSPASHYDGTSLMSASGGVSHDPCDPMDYEPAYRNIPQVSAQIPVIC